MQTLIYTTSSDQIESKCNDFCNFSDEQASNVTKLTPNFESELEMQLKEPASTDIIKKWDQSQLNLLNKYIRLKNDQYVYKLYTMTKE